MEGFLHKHRPWHALTRLALSSHIFRQEVYSLPGTGPEGGEPSRLSRLRTTMASNFQTMNSEHCRCPPQMKVSRSEALALVDNAATNNRSLRWSTSDRIDFCRGNAHQPPSTAPTKTPARTNQGETSGTLKAATHQAWSLEASPSFRVPLVAPPLALGGLEQGNWKVVVRGNRSDWRFSGAAG